MGTTSRAGALFHGKCPRCRQGDMFTYPLSKVGKFNRMNRQCPVCDLFFEREPGFWQGAMYVSYAFTIAFMVAVSIILYLLGNPPDWVYIASFLVVMVLIVPLNYRYSRIIYLYSFGGVKYDPSFDHTENG